MKFIGRESELKCLEDNYKRSSGFVVIWGRRRLGKTTLINEFIKDKKALFYTATEQTEIECMKDFATSLGEFMNNPALGEGIFSRWDDLFNLFVDYNPNEKKILVIDEVPFLINVNPAFSSILQRSWDLKMKENENIMLILCGSSTRMMLENILEYKAPLYGRRTAQINLKPLRFSTIFKNQKRSFDDFTKEFSVIGGVPKYLEIFENYKTLEENINSNIFSTSGFLYEEPKLLIKDDVDNPVSYFAILREISYGNHKLEKIATHLQLESNKISPYLQNLSNLGYIEKQVPVSEENPDKSRKGLYFISDNFMKFWFRFVLPKRSFLESGYLNPIKKDLLVNFVPKFVAKEYENMCKDILLELCLKEKIDFFPEKIGSFWSNERKNAQTEIDIMSVQDLEKKVFFGECKYKHKPVDVDVFFELKQKVNGCKELFRFTQDYTVMYGIFSKSGFTSKLLETAKITQNLYLINETKIV